MSSPTATFDTNSPEAWTTFFASVPDVDLGAAEAALRDRKDVWTEAPEAEIAALKLRVEALENCLRGLGVDPASV